MSATVNNIKITDLKAFTNTLVKKQRHRHPDKIVLILDENNYHLRVQQVKESVRVKRPLMLSFDNAVEVLKKLGVWGKGSLIIFCCGIYTVLRASNPSIYSLHPCLSSNFLISKALRLQEYILDNTVNDQVMFCDIAPIENFRERSSISKEKYDYYLNVIKEYNKFMKKHSRTMGFKSWNAIKRSFPDEESIPLSLDCLYEKVKENKLKVSTKNKIQKEVSANQMKHVTEVNLLTAASTSNSKNEETNGPFNRSFTISLKKIIKKKGNSRKIFTEQEIFQRVCCVNNKKKMDSNNVINVENIKPPESDTYLPKVVEEISLNEHVKEILQIRENTNKRKICSTKEVKEREVSFEKRVTEILQNRENTNKSVISPTKEVREREVHDEHVTEILQNRENANKNDILLTKEIREREVSLDEDVIEILQNTEKKNENVYPTKEIRERAVSLDERIKEILKNREQANIGIDKCVEMEIDCDDDVSCQMKEAEYNVDMEIDSDDVDYPIIYTNEDPRIEFNEHLNLVGCSSIQNFSTEDVSYTESKFIPGISYIIEITANDGNLAYDCILCNSLEEGKLNKLEMRIHIQTREHILNVMEIVDNELYKKRNMETTSPADLFGEICKIEDACSGKKVFATEENHETKRKSIMEKISDLKKNINMKLCDKSLSCSLESSHIPLEPPHQFININQENSKTGEESSEIKDFQKFSETLVNPTISVKRFAGTKLFEKVVIITYPHYIESMDVLRGPNVEFCEIHSNSIDDFITVMKENISSKPPNTLWLAYTGIHSTTHISLNRKLCPSSCSSSPLEIIVPNHRLFDSQNSVLDIHHYIYSVMIKMNSILNRSSSFYFLPPFPPTFWNGVTDHRTCHDAKDQHDPIYFSQPCLLKQVKELFTVFSNEINWLMLSEISKTDLPKGTLEEYCHISSRWNHHVQFCDNFNNKSYNKKFTMWCKFVGNFISDCLSLQDTPKTKSLETLNIEENEFTKENMCGNIVNLSSKTSHDNETISSEPNHEYDRLVFIGPRELLKLLPEERKFADKISMVETNAILDWVDLKLKLDSIVNLTSYKNILFLIFGNVQLVGMVNLESFCTKTNCENPLSYLTPPDLKQCSSNFERVMGKFKQLLSNIKTCFEGKSNVILLPLFPMQCVRKPKIKSDEYHNKVHQTLLRYNMCIKGGDNTKWNHVVQAFNKVWEKEMFSIFTDNGCQFRSVVHQYFPHDLNRFIERDLNHTELTKVKAFSFRRYQIFLRIFINKACPFIKFTSDLNSEIYFSLLGCVNSITEPLNNVTDCDKEQRPEHQIDTKDNSNSKVLLENTSCYNLILSLKEQNAPTSEKYKNVIKNTSSENDVPFKNKEINQNESLGNDGPCINSNNNADDISIADKNNSKFILDLSKIQLVNYEIPFQHVCIVGNQKYDTIINSNMANIKYIHYNFSSKFSQDDIPLILNKLKKYRSNSVCFLAFSFHTLVKKKSSPSCSKYKCKKCIKVLDVNGNNDDFMSINFNVSKKINEIILLVEELSTHLPVIVLPFFPEMVCCDYCNCHSKHLEHHSIAQFGSFVVHGTLEKWRKFSENVKYLWNKFVRNTYEQYFISEELNTYMKRQIDVLIFEDNENKYSFACPEIAKWESILSAFLDILVLKKEKNVNDKVSFKGLNASKSTCLPVDHATSQINCSKQVKAWVKNSENTVIPMSDSSMPNRYSPVSKCNSSMSKRDSPVPRNNSSMLKRYSPVPKRDSSMPRRDSPVPNRDSIPFNKRRRSPSSDRSEKKLKTDSYRSVPASKNTSLKQSSNGVDVEKAAPRLKDKSTSDPLIFLLGQSLYEEFIKEKEKLRKSHREEYEIFYDLPDIHHKYEYYFDEFCSKYNQEYRDRISEDHKKDRWKSYWNKKLKFMKNIEWDEKVEDLVKNYKLKSKALLSAKEEEKPSKSKVVLDCDDSFGNPSNKGILSSKIKTTKPVCSEGTFENASTLKNLKANPDEDEVPYGNTSSYKEKTAKQNYYDGPYGKCSTLMEINAKRKYNINPFENSTFKEMKEKPNHADSSYENSSALEEMATKSKYKEGPCETTNTSEKFLLEAMSIKPKFTEPSVRPTLISKLDPFPPTLSNLCTALPSSSSSSSVAVVSPIINSKTNIVKPFSSSSEESKFNSIDKFSIDETLDLLEQVSNKLGILGPALMGISKYAKEYGTDSKKTSQLLTEEENVILFQMAIDKLESLQLLSPESEISTLSKTKSLIIKLLDYNKNKCDEPEEGKIKLNLNSIANASLNKCSSFTLNLIKNAFIYEGKCNPTKKEINEAYLKVCAMHFDMTQGTDEDME